MRAFAESYPNFAFVQLLAAQMQNIENQDNAIMQASLAQIGKIGQVL